MASGLQAGQSLPQAVDTAAKEGADPVASEFRKAIVEQRLGVDITDSLDDVAGRMGSQDFRWVVMAVRIQREVGGNLAELLSTVANTLRERDYLRRQVRTLSAEGRLSAWIIGALPPAFVLYLIVIRGSYLAPMLHSTLGWLMIGYGVVSMAVGAFWLSKVVKVDA
jgi:tight adherence protein B